MISESGVYTIFYYGVVKKPWPICMCLIIFEEQAEVQDIYPLSLNPFQKADDSIQDRNRNIGPLA